MQNYELLQSGVTTFGQLYGKINNLVECLRSAFSGTSFPTNPVAGQCCLRVDRTDSRGLPKLYIYSGVTSIGEGGWVELSVFIPSGTEVEIARGSKSSLNERLSVSLNDDGTLKSTVQAYQSEWIRPSLTFSYVDSNTFRVNGDQTDIYIPKRRIKVINETGTYYSEVVTSTYSSGNTTVDIADNVISGSLIAVEHSIIKNSLTAGMLNMFTASNSTPSKPNATPIWIDTSTSPAKLKYYINDNWTEIVPVLDTSTTAFAFMILSNKTIYVDNVNGSDTTGDGSNSKPYATVSRALQDVGQFYGANVTIILKASATSYGTINLSGFVRGDVNSTITIQGETTTLVSGTVSSHSNSVDDPTYGSSVTVAKITDTTKNWTTDQWKHKLLRVYKSGTSYYRIITNNDATSIYCSYTFPVTFDNTWSYEILNWGTKCSAVNIYDCFGQINVNYLSFENNTFQATIRNSSYNNSFTCCSFKVLAGTSVSPLYSNRSYVSFSQCLIDMNNISTIGLQSFGQGNHINMDGCIFTNCIANAIYNNYDFSRIDFKNGSRIYKGSSNPSLGINMLSGMLIGGSTYGKAVIDAGSTGISLTRGAYIQSSSGFYFGSNVTNQVTGYFGLIDGGKLLVYDYFGVNVTNHDYDNLHSRLQIQGSIATQITTVSSNVTLGVGNHIVLVSASAGAKTITLPDATTCNGRQYIVKKTDSSANTVTLSPQSGQTIDGASSYVLSTQYQYVKVVSDGTNWYRIG